MVTSMRIEKTALVAYILLIVGVVLLIFTFAMAYIMLSSVLSILAAPDLSGALGKILGPLAEAIIKVLYLAVMGYVGSILTIRGIQLYKEVKATSQPPPQTKTESKKKSQKS